MSFVKLTVHFIQYKEREKEMPVDSHTFYIHKEEKTSTSIA